MARSGFTIKVTKDNSEAVKRQLNENISLALNAMGIKSVNLVVSQMQNGYGRPIRQTGDLQRDVHYIVEGNELIVGNNLEYSIWVHDGTRKMAARQYIRDTFFSHNNIAKLITVGEAYFKRGFI